MLKLCKPLYMNIYDTYTISALSLFTVGMSIATVALSSKSPYSNIGFRAGLR